MCHLLQTEPAREPTPRMREHSALDADDALVWGYLLLHWPAEDTEIPDTAFELESMLWEMAVFEIDGAMEDTADDALLLSSAGVLFGKC
jgi:hypothetical protein